MKTPILSIFKRFNTTKGRPSSSGQLEAFEAIFSSMSEGFLILDLEQKILQLNHSAERILGVSREAILGKDIAKFLPEDLKWSELLLDSGEESRSVLLRNHSWENRAGENFVTDFSLSPILDTDGEMQGWLILIRDVSRIQRLEEEKRNGERLAMMGTVAAGLAHEIKNPLGGIKGAAQLLLREVEDQHQKECLEIITKESDRVNNLISDLLTFSRPRKTARKSVNINQILNTLLTLQEQDKGSNDIKIRRGFDPSLPKIQGDPDQLTQAFLNLIRNAFEAISKKGELAIGTKMMMGYKIHGEKNKKWQMVEVTIQDNGCGMNKREQEALFTPFFTTKKRGTGLGLALTQRIIHEHHGMIQFDSQKGKGTKVQVYLRVPT
jgi:two-component system, NtrC family, nitrogen regulation sensor histidine kinase GlnL